jgi:transcriptional regulator with XRE-family HTH domain
MPEQKGASRDPDAICLGLIVKRLRVQRGWTIRQLAVAIGVHPTHLGVIERGGNLLSMNSFLNLVRVMDLDPGEIIREVIETGRQFRKRPDAPPPPPPLEPETADG